MASEKKFQADLIKKIEGMFPGCYVLKNDPTFKQGIPDLIVLHKNKWAMLEVKDNPKSKHRPNQDLRVKDLNKMSFASFIYPENMEEVLHDLQQTFES